jgi:hypothetical protein
MNTFIYSIDLFVFEECVLIQAKTFSVDTFNARKGNKSDLQVLDIL